MAGNKLIIIGAGGLAREAAWAARESVQRWDPIGYLDDDLSLHGTCLSNLPVLGPIADWGKFKDAHFLVAIGSPRVRQRIVREMQMSGEPSFGIVIHRSAQISDFVKIGCGSLICANATITTQIEIGDHVVINPNCNVGHDTHLGSFTLLAPLVACSGNVTIGHGVEIGAGTAILQGLTIGSGAMIGMGSVLTKSVPDNALWLGNPAAERRILEPFSK